MSNRASVDHHRQLEIAFRSAKAALSAAQRNRAHTELKLLLTAHQDAAHSVQAELAALEQLQPMTREYYQKLEHIRSAVADRAESFEGTWFPAHDPTPVATQIGSYGGA